jgi:hypothetical protein
MPDLYYIPDRPKIESGLDWVLGKVHAFTFCFCLPSVGQSPDPALRRKAMTIRPVYSINPSIQLSRMKVN